VAGIFRPALGRELARKALDFLALYGLVVAILAGRFDLTAKEKLPIAPVRDLVIRDYRAPGSAGAFAGLAPGHSGELRRPPKFPGFCKIPFPPGLIAAAFLIGGLATFRSEGHIARALVLA
jgi:hypothetical protein